MDLRDQGVRGWGCRCLNFLKRDRFKGNLETAVGWATSIVIPTLDFYPSCCHCERKPETLHHLATEQVRQSRHRQSEMRATREKYKSTEKFRIETTRILEPRKIVLHRSLPADGGIAALVPLRGDATSRVSVRNDSNFDVQVHGKESRVEMP